MSDRRSGRRRGPRSEIAHRRPSLLGQVLLLGVFVQFYDDLRDLAPARIHRADANAAWIERVERSLHLDVEARMNAWLAGHHTLGLLAGDWYDVAHFFVTLPLLLLLWWRAAPSAYRWLRNAFVLANVVGFAVYLVVPLTPPRLLPGYADVVAQRHALGGWSSTLSRASDQYASMPSLHLAWALWCVVAVRHLTRRRLPRALALAYPVVTLVVILATGNHWVLDAVAGGLTFAAAMVAANLLRDRASRWNTSGAEVADRPRVLVLSASMGAGHDGAAYELARRLERTGHAVTVRDYLEALPLRLGYFIRWFYAMQLDHAPASYEWHYRAMRTGRVVLSVSNWFARLARHRVLRMVRGARADVVVSTYPLASQALGRLRALGRLDIPLVTFVTDFSVHPATVSSDVDLNLCITSAAAREATRLCGRPAVATGPLVPEVFAPLPAGESRAALRRELGLPEDRLLVLVAAGSWGVGNVRTTVERLAGQGGVTPVVACGRNEELHATLAGLPGVVALGWRKDMPRLLQACDAVVENAGGLTAMEAMASGVPVVSHETIPGHGCHNAEEMQQAGASTWVLDPADLGDTLVALTGTPRGEQQAAAARALFVADAAVVVSALSTDPDLRTALAAAGIAAPTGLFLARRNGWLRLRRRVIAGAAAVACALYVGTEGVAFATEHGVGVTTTIDAHDVSLVVRMTPQDLAVPGVAASLRSARAVAAIDDTTLQADPDAVASLAAQEVPLANAGSGCRHWADPEQSYDDLVSARNALDRAAQRRVRIFVPCRRLTATDIGTALLAGEHIVRPGVAQDPSAPVGPLQGGSVVWVDGRRASPDQLVGFLHDLAGKAAAQGLSLTTVTGTRA